MKYNRAAVMAVSLALVAGSGAQSVSGADGTSVSALYRQGLSALEDGDAEIARQSFVEVLRRQPNHINARINLDRLRSRTGELATTRRKALLKKIVIPNVDYDEVPLPEALEALSVVIKAETKGKFNANFVVRDPGRDFAKRPVTLKLSGVPASVVLEHLLSLADAQARYDQYAILVRPLNASAVVKTPKVPKIE